MITKVKGKYVIGFDGTDHVIIPDGEVVFEDDTIIYTGRHYEGRTDKTEDAGNAVIMPGFIDLNALGDIDHDILHTEAYGNVRSSLNPSEEYFDKGTHEVMTAEEEAFKSLYAYAQLILHGITTAMPITSTYYKKWADTYEEEEAGVHHAGRLGLRLYTSPSYQCGLNVVRSDGTMTVRYLEGAGEEGLERAVKFIGKYDGAYDGLIKGALLPERIETQTEENLIRTKKFAEELNCPIKLHAAQGPFEYRFIREKTGKSPIEYLDSLGFLGKNVGIPHCYIVKGTRWVEDDGDDLEILSRTGTTAIFCPIIIGRSGHYQDSFAEYRRRKINVAVGTDTFPPDFFQNVRTASMFSQMAEEKVEGSSFADVYRAVTLGGSSLLGRNDLGRLCAGAKADMIAVDLDDFHMGAADDPIRTIFMCGSGRDVKLSVINGRVVMKDRKLDGIDLEELKAKGQKYYEKMRLGYLERDYRHLPEDELFRPSFRVVR
ncbi:chlorohydrolase family protein [Clostridium sp. AM58-1XD]|uniref:chlorohydrolase family protein n=1 Tax=Clostridium sp. AM58-1XD TaxID=2292307 RepID=UPI000E471554|nr:chlorohydrolase family protein [Clostridium sp. AM58-1XD]RGZ00479.1 ethylammeline chlorohydrolase [Clostridium sp. AM58-1XD]